MMKAFTRRAAIAAALAHTPAQAQGRPDPGEIRGLKLGLKAQAMTLDSILDLIRGARRVPAERDSFYNILQTFDDSPVDSSLVSRPSSLVA